MPTKVYYLDDEPDLLEMFTETFSKEGRQIETFSSPAEAIKAVAKCPPDVLFIDYRLPDCTGDEIARKLPSGFPKILITGDILVNTTFQFDAIYEKPYRPDTIESYLESLEQKKAAV